MKNSVFVKRSVSRIIIYVLPISRIKTKFSLKKYHLDMYLMLKNVHIEFVLFEINLEKRCQIREGISEFAGITHLILIY